MKPLKDYPWKGVQIAVVVVALNVFHPQSFDNLLSVLTQKVGDYTFWVIFYLSLQNEWMITVTSLLRITR